MKEKERNSKNDHKNIVKLYYGIFRNYHRGLLYREIY